jgi:hypothetical protein
MKTTTCDFCKTNECKTLQIELGCRNGLLGYVEINYGYIDICPSCFMKLVLAYFKDEDPQTAQEIIRILTCPERKAA